MPENPPRSIPCRGSSSRAPATSRFTGRSLHGVPPRKIVSLGLTQVPEGRRVFADMTVEENLDLGAYTRPSSEVDRSIADVYERFPRLKERRRQFAGTLSGGEQQMLAMGSAVSWRTRSSSCSTSPPWDLAPILVAQIFRDHPVRCTIGRRHDTARGAERAVWPCPSRTRAYVLETGTVALSGTGEELHAIATTSAAPTSAANGLIGDGFVSTHNGLVGDVFLSTYFGRRICLSNVQTSSAKVRAVASC